MARTAINVTKVVRAGVVDPAGQTGDQTNGMMMVNDGNTWLEINNAVATARVITIITPPTYQGEPVQDLTITVPISAVRYKVGPFPVDLVNRPAGTVDAGNMYVDFVANGTDLTIRAFN